MTDPIGASKPELDLSSVDSKAGLARCLRQQQVLAGKPSIREIARLSKRAALERQGIVLSSSSVGAYLKGDRLPAPSSLQALLRALNVPSEHVDEWMQARNRVHVSGVLARELRDASGNVPDEGAPDEPGEPAAARTPCPQDRAAPAGGWPWRTRAAMASAALAGVVLAGAVAWSAATSRDVSTIGCVPESCDASSVELTVTGRLSEDLGEGDQPFLLTYVEGMQRWYLASSALLDDEGRWSETIGVGRDEPQTKDRHFKICLWLLPLPSIDVLTQQQLNNRGGGLPADLLPRDARKVACTAARRLRNT